MTDYSKNFYFNFTLRETGKTEQLGVNDLQDSKTDANVNTINNIIRNLSSGQMSVEQAVTQLKDMGAELSVRDSQSRTTISFNYNGKSYTVYTIKNRTFEETANGYNADYIAHHLQTRLNERYNPSASYPVLEEDLEIFVKELCDTQAGSQLKNLINRRSVKDLVKALMKEVPVNDYMRLRDFVEGFRDVLKKFVTSNPDRINQIYQNIENDKKLSGQNLKQKLQNSRSCYKTRLLSNKLEKKGCLILQKNSTQH